MTEAKRAPSQLSTRNKRSFPNLHHLSLAPLSSQFPLEPSDEDSADLSDGRTPRTSYIQPKTAPTTPGILSLSRSSSRHRRNRSSKALYLHEGYFATSHREPGDSIPKAKSSSALLDTQANRAPTTYSPAAPKGSLAPLTLVTAQTAHARPSVTSHEDEWLHRAGLAIASETRDSKGQGWLVRRESSTSLVHQSDEFTEHPGHEHSTHHLTLLSGEHFADDEYSPVTPRYGNSRWSSRAASRRTSRRGSKVELYTPARTPGARSVAAEEDYFGQQGEILVEPDFVEPLDEESVGDEEEVARLARENTHGLGGWVDKLIGWTLFNVAEDGEEEEEEETPQDSESERAREDERKRRELAAQRKKDEMAKIVASSAVRAPKAEDETQKDSKEEGGWQDAAWLLSVAAKVIL